MSTKQLIVLWYGGILMFLLLLLKVSSLTTIGIGAAVLFFLLLYTLSRHHQANKRQVMLAIGFPMMLFGIGAFIFGGSADNPSMYWQSAPLNIVPPSDIQVVDPKVAHSLFSDKISGKIQNNSAVTVKSVTLRILLGADAKTAEAWHVKVAGINAAAGASASFAERIGDYRLKFNKNTPWSFQVVAVEVEQSRNLHHYRAVAKFPKDPKVEIEVTIAFPTKSGTGNAVFHPFREDGKIKGESL